ncbi:MAG: hypothetical protein PHC69_09700 [Ruminiclostridium sp.]|nr:hypothetical protein [Ruminiclostridium sp.]
METEKDTREVVISLDCGLDMIKSTDVVVAYIKEKYGKRAFFYGAISGEQMIFDSATGVQINNDEYLKKIDYANISHWYHYVDVISLKDYGLLAKRNSFDAKDNITKIIRHELLEDVDRENPLLIKVAKELYWYGAELKAIRIPQNIEYDIILWGGTHECVVEKGHYWS